MFGSFTRETKPELVNPYVRDMNTNQIPNHFSNYTQTNLPHNQTIPNNQQYNRHSCQYNSNTLQNQRNQHDINNNSDQYNHYNDHNDHNDYNDYNDYNDHNNDFHHDYSFQPNNRHLQQTPLQQQQHFQQQNNFQQQHNFQQQQNLQQRQHNFQQQQQNLQQHTLQNKVNDQATISSSFITKQTENNSESTIPKTIQKLRNEQYKLFTKRLDHALLLFNLQSIFTYEQLQAAYRKMALQYHPDKGGDSGYFDFIKEEKEFLRTYLDSTIDEANKKQQHATNMDLIMNYRSHQYEKQDNHEKHKNHEHNSNPNTTFTTTNGRLHQEKFNKFYDENRLTTPYDNGYGNWLKESCVGPCPLIDENHKTTTVVNKDIDNTQFNDIFRQKQYESNDISSDKGIKAVTEIQRFQRIDQLQPLYDTASSSLNSYGLCELDQSEVNDFSAGEMSTYGVSDLKKAYGNDNLVDERNAMLFIHQNRTMDSLKKERETDLSLQLSAEEQRYLENVEKLKREKERERRQRIAQHDDFLNEYEQQINRKRIIYN